MTIRFDALCVRELHIYITTKINASQTTLIIIIIITFLIECSKQRVVKNRRRRRQLFFTREGVIDRRQLFFTREGVIDARSILLHVDEVSAGGGKQSHQYLRNVMHRILDVQVVLEPIKLRVPRVQDTA